jgi:hypothetical protein
VNRYIYFVKEYNSNNNKLYDEKNVVHGAPAVLYAKLRTGFDASGTGTGD